MGWDASYVCCALEVKEYWFVMGEEWCGGGKNRRLVVYDICPYMMKGLWVSAKISATLCFFTTSLSLSVCAESRRLRLMGYDDGFWYYYSFTHTYTKKKKKKNIFGNPSSLLWPTSEPKQYPIQTSKATPQHKKDIKKNQWSVKIGSCSLWAKELLLPVDKEGSWSSTPLWENIREI